MQHSFTIGGDPQSVGISLNNFLNANPGARVVSMCAAPYMLKPQSPVLQPGQQQGTPIHVLYVVVEGDITEMPKAVKGQQEQAVN